MVWLSGYEQALEMIWCEIGIKRGDEMSGNVLKN